MARSNGVETIPFPHDFWAEAEAESWPPAERYVAAYLLTCSERLGVGREGLFPMSTARICEQQSNWSAERVEKALHGLEARGWLVRYDGWFFIPRVMEYDQPNGELQARGSVNRLEMAPRHSMIWLLFVNAADVVAAHLSRALARDAASRPLSKGLRKGLRMGDLGLDPTTGLGSGRGFEGASGRGQRVVGTPAGGAGARDTTPDFGVGGSPSSSSAEPHGNAPGGDARTFRDDDDQAVAA